MIINCDIGERGADHPVDRELMSLIGIANLACGGHAGDQTTIKTFRCIAKECGVKLSAHLSYPDRVHFGRRSLRLSRADLFAALDEQWSRVPDLDMVKFHGALYTDSMTNKRLAEDLGDWLHQRAVQKILCSPVCHMKTAAVERGIEVLKEAFLDRRYQIGNQQTLELVPRSHPDGCITDVAAGLEQAEHLIKHGCVVCIAGGVHPLVAETCCLHSDSPIALELATKVSQRMKEWT